MNEQELWQTVLAEVELDISRANFSTWFQGTKLISISDEGGVVVGVPNAFTKEWLENKFNSQLFKILKNHESRIKTVNYEVIAGINEILSQQIAKTPKRKTFISKEQLNLSDLEIDRETGLNPTYHFNNFVVGSFNELAHAAALSVCQNPGRSYNPLFIYGGTGVGKTHLLQAVGNEVRRDKPNLKIKYLPCEKFTTELVWAIRNKRVDDFKNKYRGVDVLILDDIQFISGKEKTQEEFFHTFNALYETNKQIILSSDRPPRAIAMLEERLRSRFEGGMIADIGFPDFETRVAILKEKAKEKGFELSDEAINYIAANIQKNIRELEGALNKISATAVVNGSSLAIKEIQRSLRHIIMKPKHLTSPKKIIQTVSEFYETDEKTMLDKSRRQEVVKPRQIVMYLLREELNWSYPSIGEKLGGRDHTTVMHACEKITNGLKENEGLQEEINFIKQRIYNV